MRSRFVPLAVCICALAAHGQIREVVSDAELSGPLFAFHKGYLYWSGLADTDKAVTLYEPNGRLKGFFATDEGPAGSVAVDTDGGIAVAISRWHETKYNGIELRDANWQLLKKIRTDGFAPRHLAFGPDHTLWCFGRPLDSKGRTDFDGMTVRKYLRDGTLAGAYLPRSLFPRALEPSLMIWQWVGIQVSKDRVGIRAVSGEESSAQTEWLELDLSGNLLGRWRVDDVTKKGKPALAADGEVFLQDQWVHNRIGRALCPLYRLDRQAGQWKRVESAPSGFLLGADGDALVFARDYVPGKVHLLWYEHP